MYRFAILILLFVSLTSHAAWNYRSKADKMRERTVKLAENTSRNRIQLAFPYQGGSALQIILVDYGDQEIQPVLFLRRGLFNCPYIVLSRCQI